MSFKYLSFTGQSGCYAELPLAVLAGASTFAIEFKLATTSTKSSTDYWKNGHICGREIGGNWKDDFGFFITGGKLGFWAEPISGGSSSASKTTTNAVVNDGLIHKVAVVSSNGAIDLYCDGALVAHTADVNAKITDSQTILLAQDSDSASYLQMDLYEARFWNVARTQEQIFADIDGTESGLQAWYLPSADGLLDYSGNAYHATLYGNPAYTEIDFLPVSLTLDVQRKVKNNSKLYELLKVYLPFDSNATEDLGGNTWSAYGNPTIGTNGAISGNALQLDGASRLKLNGSITLGGKDFTICGRATMNSSAQQWAGLFALNGNYLRIIRYNTLDNAFELGYQTALYRVNLSTALTSPFHFELDYQHSTGKWLLFFNGVLVYTVTKSLARTTYNNVWVGANGDNSSVEGTWGGSIDEFQIYDGVALHTENFTPPTAEDYFGLKRALNSPTSLTLSFDVARHISNRVEFSVDVARVITDSNFISVNQSFDVARKIVKTVNFSVDVVRIVQKIWRYVNLGTADDLITSGTTLTNRTKAQSITGTAFYQTTRAKCFDIPVTNEIWIKFDVYFDGSNRWRAYNGGANGVTGITAQTDNEITYFANGNEVHAATNTAKTNQLQTVLLHMVSGSSAGVVEAWVDGNFIYRYTGNVNHGQDFADIYLQSDGSGTFFSNVIISNARIGLNDGYQTFSVDVVRRLKNRVRVSFAVARHLIVPFRVPFIGEHFNHLFTSFNIFRDKRQKINLPKKSKAYVRCTGTGVIRVFSDTNPDGVATGTDFSTQGCMYAELDACNSISIELSPKATPLQVIKKFATCPKTGTTSGTYLDKAINYASNGKFATKDALVAQFFDDLNNADSYVSFLREKCGVILGNDDTGAIIGVDASDTVIKTAQSIVPEPIPVKDWVTPAQGSTTTIEGLDIYFPTTGANGALNGTEKHILAGLNSVWIEQALKLIYNSLGLHASTLSWNDCYVIFVNDSETPFTAYVAIKSTGSIVPNYYYELVINMAYYSDIDKTSEDGRLIPSSPNYHAAGYFDRVIAHELTHVFTEALNHPLFIAEGLAELVHGIDDLREGDIVELLTTRKSDLADVFSTGGTTDNADPYAAGYLFLRYLAKQGQGYDNDVMSIPAEMTVTNLLISDGATDSEYNALTDNTRQTFSLDVSRTLNKHVAFGLDVVIRDVIPVNFSLDVARAILAELILFPIDNAPLLRKVSLKQTGTKNTQGLQSFEVTISEQQITEQVKFAGIIPFDILQKVNGQYLDYHFDMRVEKVQQEGIIYRCECCSDLDQLLFTQLAYTIPPTTWRKVGADDKTVEIQTYYPPATAHVQKIASVLGLTPVMQFDNFLSTVLMDDLGGVTYNDLIRDVFGWSSRVPHMLINCYIRNGKLFVIQRGHEANTIDISNAKCTMPVITKELIRTTWGSTPWSKTQTTEFQHSTWQAGVPDDVTISGGSDTGGGGSGGSTIPSGDDTEEKVREVSTSFYGKDYSGNTTYTYDKKGLLVQTYTHMEKDVPNSFASQITNTTVTHGYDDDNTMIYTETNVQSFGPDGDSSSRSIEEKGYVILPNGEKFLAWESSATYQNDSSISLSNSDLVDSRVTIHSPSRVGQSHTITIGTDGEIIGAAAGQNTGDDRVTPFSKYKTALLSKQLFKKSSGGSSGGGSGSDSGGSSGGGSGSDSGGSSGGEWTTDKETWELTTNGLSLYDSSFPIHDEATLIKVTNALKWLNRKTQETLIISVYEFPHLIDFNDRVVFNGKTYFLVNNTAATTPRIFNEQNLTLARWY